jgi:uncharacterized protein YggE
MLSMTQAIPHPHGVTAFGSAQIRVVPDIAEVQLSITRIQEKPRDAFAETGAVARALSAALAECGIASSDVATDRAVLQDAWQGRGQDSTHVGFEAKIRFRVIVRDLDQLETVLTRAVEAGANQITMVRLHTSRLAELRAQARRGAIAAAREKAMLYAEAAGAKLGRILHIEDRNPVLMESVRKELEQGNFVGTPEQEPATTATPPGAVDVSAAVLVAYALLPQ